MDTERRDTNRHIIETQPDGFLFLHIDQQPVAILKLEDISPYGLGLHVPGQVRSGSSTCLRYRQELSNGEINGQVAWSSPSELVADKKPACRVGISFYEDDILSSVDFFNAITSR